MEKTNNILDEFWYGSFDIPSDIALDGELGNFYDEKIVTLENALLETFSDEQKKIFETYKENVNFWHDRVEKENFKFGFKMSYKILSELYKDDEL